MLKYRVIEIDGGAQEAANLLNNMKPTLDVLSIISGWRKTTIIYRELSPDVPDFYPNGVLFPNGPMLP